MSVRPRVRGVVLLPVVLSLAPAVLASAGAASAAEPPDLLPPAVEVVAPPRTGQVSEDRPQIVVSFSDPGSGIDGSSVRLALDGVDVTGAAQVDTSLDGSWQATYTPAIPLHAGPHELWFQVADLAGNMETVRQTFHIEAPRPLPGVQVGGRSVLGVSVLPLKQVTGMLDLQIKSEACPAAKSRSRPLTWEGRVKVVGQTGMAGLNEAIGPATGRIAEYAVALTGDKAKLAAGAVLIDFPSPLLSAQPANDGVQSSVRLSGPAGTQWDLTGFHGRSLSSQGFSLELVDFTGAAVEVNLAAPVQADAVLIEAKERSNHTRVQTLGVALPGPAEGTIRIEAVQSDSPARVSAHAVSARFDAHPGYSALSLEWWRSAAGFDSPLLLPELAGSGGVRRIRTRWLQAFPGTWALDLDLISFRDNLDVEEGLSASADNAAISLRHVPPGPFSYTATYRLEQRVGSPADSNEAGSHRYQVGVSLDYRGEPGGRSTSGRARLSRSFSGNGDSLATTAGISCSREYSPAALETALEYSIRRILPTPAQTDSYRFEVSLVPHLSFNIRGLRSRLTGRITAAYSREDHLDCTSGIIQSSAARTSLSARLAVGLSSRDTLALTGERIWGDRSDYQLKCEYRRTL